MRSVSPFHDDSIAPAHLFVLCSHSTFHRDCILTWLAENHNDCPSCRFAPLYDMEKYDALMAEHPDAEVTTRETPAVAPRSQMAHYRLVYWVVVALIIQVGIMSFFIYGPSSRTDREEPYQLTNLTMSCVNVSIPFASFSVRESSFCTSRMRHSCSVCAAMEPDQCLCFCREEIEVSGIQYLESSKCCKCTRTMGDA